MRRTIAAVCLCVPMLASAEFYTGNTLKQYMDEDAAISARGNRGTPDQAHSAGVALGFIIGVHDVYRGRSICTQSGVTAGQLMDIVRAYFRAIPHRLHENAEVLVEEALTRIFPCQQRQNQQRGA